MKIFNTSPLILLLDEINEPQWFDLFRRLDKNLLIPETVRGEIKNRASREKLEKLVSNGTVKICSDCPIADFEMMKNRFPGIDKGEINVISLTHRKNRANTIAIIDEAKGRKVAEKLKIPFRGVFGLMLELYNHKIIDVERLKRTCRKIDKSAFRIDFEKLGYKWLTE